MTRLSVNLNKVATVRNARGGAVPSLVDAMHAVVDAGATGITVHPRADARHVTAADVHDLARSLSPLRETVEFNLEGDPRPDFVEMVDGIGPHQCTLVPVRPGEITSEAGWPLDSPRGALVELIAGWQERGIRVSLFVDPEVSAVDWAADLGADRVELYTEPYARSFARGVGPREASLRRYAAASQRAVDRGLGVNAGHDLDLDNLAPLVAALPRLDEVSIGHALIARALFVGITQVVGEYLAVLRA